MINDLKNKTAPHKEPPVSLGQSDRLFADDQLENFLLFIDLRHHMEDATGHVQIEWDLGCI